MPIGRDGTGYAIVPCQDGSYGVQIIKPGDVPHLMGCFDTEADAESWIQQWLDAPPRVSKDEGSARPNR